MCIGDEDGADLALMGKVGGPLGALPRRREHNNCNRQEDGDDAERDEQFD